jgi:hypothetical protein
LIEHLYDRIGVALPREPTKYAIMKTAAWAYPVRDPWVDDVPWFFKGDVVQISKEGYQLLDTDVEIAFFTGLCSGIFFYGEAVEVLPWPFLTQPGPHHYKYIAKGGGQKVAYGGGGGTAPPGSAAISNDDDRIGGGNDAFHFISTDGRGAPDGFLFPGVDFPPAKDPGTVDLDTPIEWNWAAAEGKFYPIVQPPSN